MKSCLLKYKCLRGWLVGVGWRRSGSVGQLGFINDFGLFINRLTDGRLASVGQLGFVNDFGLFINRLTDRLTD